MDGTNDVIDVFRLGSALQKGSNRGFVIYKPQDRPILEQRLVVVESHKHRESLARENLLSPRDPTVYEGPREHSCTSLGVSVLKKGFV